MSRVVLCAVLALLIGTIVTRSSTAAEPTAKNSKLGKLRHVVIFKFKDGTTPQQIKAIEEGFRALPSKIPQVIDLEWGTDVGVEGLSQGFTHCFLVTFNDAAGRAVYLPHAAHQAFVKVLKPHLDKVLVIDYVAKD